MSKVAPIRERRERQTNLFASLFVISLIDLVGFAIGVGLYYGVKDFFLWVLR